MNSGAISVISWVDDLFFQEIQPVVSLLLLFFLSLQWVCWFNVFVRLNVWC